MASGQNTPQDAAYWYVPVSRAVIAAVLAVIITFSADHSPVLGSLVFGGFAVVSGLVGGLTGGRALERGVERSAFLAQAIITIVAGVVALAFPRAGLGFLLFLISAWAVVAGFLELYAGLRSRRRHAASRDWIFVGALTVALAVAVLIVPPNLSEQFTGPDGVQRVLNASVVVVGALGAYGAIVAVYLIIAGLSLKWAPTAATQDGIAS